MGLKHTTWAWDLEHPDLRGADKFVLLAICDRMNDADPERGCWPSTAELSRRVGKSVRYVQVAVARLESIGLVTRQMRRSHPTIYRVPSAELASTQAMPASPALDQAMPASQQTMPASPTDDARIAYQAMPASPAIDQTMPASQQTMPASRTGDARITQTVREQERTHIPPLTPRSAEPDPGSAPTTVGGGGGGGEEFSIEESFEESRQRLVEWWNTRVVPIDDRVLPTPTVTNEQIRAFRDRLREFPDLEDRVVEGLDPVASWVQATITIELVCKSKTATQKVVGGLFRSKDREKREARAQARKLEDRLRRKAQIRSADPSTLLTGETFEVEHIPA